MAGEDKFLKVKVDTTGSDPSGAKQTADALLDVSKATKEHGEASDELEKSTLRLNTAQGENRRILQDMANLAPGLREAISAAEGVTGALGLALLAAVKLKEGIEELDRQQTETLNRLSEGFTDYADSFAEAQRKMQAETDATTIKLKDLETQQKKNKQAVDDEIAAIRAKELAEIAVYDAQLARDLAAVDAKKKLGESPVDAAREEAKLKSDAEARRNALVSADETKTIAAKQKDLDAEKQHQKQLQDIITAGDADRLNREGRLGALPAEITKREAAFEQSKKDLKAAQVAAAAQGDTVERVRTAVNSGEETDPFTLHQAEQNKARADEAVKEAEEDKNANQSALDAARNEKQNFETEKKNYKDAKAAIKGVTDAVADLNREVEKLKQAHIDADANRSTLSEIHAQTEFEKQIPGIAGSANALATANKATLQAVENVLKGVLDSVQATMSNVKAVHGNTAALQAQTDELKREIADVHARITRGNINFTIQ